MNQTPNNFPRRAPQPKPPMAPTSRPQTNDAPRQDNNIMNIRGTLDSSLYQICLSLRRRLAHVPGFHQYLAEMEEEEAEADGATDPVTSMWNCLRRGYPLMTIYNASKPHSPLHVDANRLAERQIGKAATFKFLQACLTDLMIPANECFLITDLYGGDTTGFVKVTKVVNKVLDQLDERGLLLPSDPRFQDHDQVPGQGSKSTKFQHVVREIVDSERTYVQHLELLQQAKNELEAGGTVPRDSIHDIFLNLNTLLDFQRRFLIRIEQQNSLPESQQNWGQLFIQYRDSFRVYEPFIANQTRCNETIIREWDKISASPHSSNINDLFESQPCFDAFCVKPFQRLSKYPLLLKQLRSSCELDPEREADLVYGEAAANSLMQRASEAVAREQRNAAVADLNVRVEDWKGHDIRQFGELLLYGNFTVVKGEGAKPTEREYIIYLFEKILLCCKEINPNKQRPRVLRNERTPTTVNGRVRLQLKGRIFMQNVTDVLSFVKTEKSSYTIQIFWKGDPAVENFVIRFSNETEMNKWRHQIQEQKKSLSEQARSTGQTGTSETVFTSMRTQSQPENPYLQNEEVEEEDDSTLSPGTLTSEFAMSRNASSNSLRNIAAQNGSRGPPSRLGFADHGMQPPLSLNTNVPASVDSPGDFPGNSYFSPSADSPSSTRSSSQANLFPFPRQGTPSNHWSQEDNKHRTAPATSGPSSREGNGLLNAYQINGRTVLRPSLPVMPANQASHAAQQLAMAQSRMRSASTPNILDPPAVGSNGTGSKRYANGQLQPTIDNVPVPPIPSHMAQMRAPLNRSQTSSPTNIMSGARSATQSPMPPHGRPGQHAEQAIHNQSSSSHERHPGSQGDQRTHNQGGCGPAPIQVLRSPPMPMHTAPEGQIPYPSQLKVKIWFDPAPSHVTIVVPIVIKHRSLIDRIDSKMVKISSASISKGTARLRYKDMENDLLTIGSDEDVQLAIEDWGLAHEERLREGVVSDFELHWEEK
ncbi:Guanine nucleotide exchange factor for Cdc42p [Xanthoria calcicola]